MVKVRNQKALDDFENGSELKLDPNATRTHKAIKIPFNEYEYLQLEELAKKTNRSKSNAIRWAILKANSDIK